MASQNKTRIVRATEENLPAISDLAGVIWRACYPGIITRAQIDYMLARMYSLDTLRDEIRSQGIRYDILLVDGKPAGFASYGPAAGPGVMKLHKLYLLPELHGRGLGRLLLQHVEQTQCQSHCRLPTKWLRRRGFRGHGHRRRFRHGRLHHGEGFAGLSGASVIVTHSGLLNSQLPVSIRQNVATKRNDCSSLNSGCKNVQ